MDAAQGYSVNPEVLNMLAICPYTYKGTPKSCAGCGQPFVIRGGQSEAIVGEDGQLYCYDTMCDHCALVDKSVARKRLANGLFACV